MNLNDFVKSRNSIEFVIPAKAGIQLFQKVLDPGFRRGDGSRDFYDFINFKYSAFPIPHSAFDYSMMKFFFGPNLLGSPMISRTWSPMRKAGGGQPGT